MYNVLLLTIVTTLYVRALEFIHIIIGSLYLWPASPLPHPNQHSALCCLSSSFSWTLHRNESMPYLSFCVCLFWLSTMSSEFMHVVATDRRSLLPQSWGTLCCVNTFSYLITCPWTLRLFPSLAYPRLMPQWSWGCRYLFVTVIFISLGYVSRNGIAEPHGLLFLMSSWNSTVLPWWAHSFTCLRRTRISFSPSPSTNHLIYIPT